MNDVIEILEREHRIIEDAIRKLSVLKEQCPRDHSVLAKLEKSLLEHISKEDSQVYVPLKKIVKLSAEAAQFLEASRQGLEDVKILALVFFEKYRGTISDALCAEFKSDFLRLKGKIEERIRFEDEKLFPFLRNLWSKL